MIIDDALSRFLVQLEANGRSPHTFGQYRRHVRLFAAWWRDVGPGGAADKVEALHHRSITSTLVFARANESPGHAAVSHHNPCCRIYLVDRPGRVGAKTTRVSAVTRKRAVRRAM